MQIWLVFHSQQLNATFVLQIDLSTGQQVDRGLNGALCASHQVQQKVYATATDSAGWVWSVPSTLKPTFTCFYLLHKCHL